MEFWIEQDEHTLWHWCTKLPNGQKWVSAVGRLFEQDARDSANFFGYMIEINPPMEQPA